MTDKNPREAINAVFKLYEELNRVMDENDEEIDTLKREIETVLGTFDRDVEDVGHTVEEKGDSYIVTFDFGMDVSEEMVDIVTVSETRAIVKAGGSGITIHLPDDTNAEDNTMNVKNGVVTVKFGRDS